MNSNSNIIKTSSDVKSMQLRLNANKLSLQQAEFLTVNTSSLRNAQSDIIHQNEALSFHKSNSSAFSPIKGSISSYNEFPPVDQNLQQKFSINNIL